jgi:hypothetical protein
VAEEEVAADTAEEVVVEAVAPVALTQVAQTRNLSHCLVVQLVGRLARLPTDVEGETLLLSRQGYRSQEGHKAGERETKSMGRGQFLTYVVELILDH